jgi:hypothetical protein
MFLKILPLALLTLSLLILYFVCFILGLAHAMFNKSFLMSEFYVVFGELYLLFMISNQYFHDVHFNLIGYSIFGFWILCVVISSLLKKGKKIE